MTNRHLEADLSEEREPEAPLPKEAERRIVGDADTRGLPLVLQGRETWYIPALPLSPRGQHISALIDELEALEVDVQAAAQSETAAEKRLTEATEDDAIETARVRLQAAVAKRRKANQDLRVAHRELAFHALRQHYRLTRDEVGLLVTQRHWADVVAALHGKDTEANQVERAIDVLARFKRAVGDVTEKGA